MTAISPRVDRRLLDAAEILDRPDQPYAEIWRQVGVVAETLGLTRPGYDTIRRFLRDRRRRRQEIRHLVEPVVSDALRGRFGAWDRDRLLEAREVARAARSVSSA